MLRFSYQHGIGVFFGLLILILAYQGVREAKAPTMTKVESEVTCIGSPIKVDFAYEWTVAEPHSCAVQCQDGRPRYILYANGMGTQCEAPPGCNDYGEDNGVTCKPPVAS